jgi:CubicO group peptidase (beta-lactamase class C family)
MMCSRCCPARSTSARAGRPLRSSSRASSTDRLLVRKAGRTLGDWVAATADRETPHLVFSISKSLTAMLAGSLQRDGLFDPTLDVVDVLPEAVGSAWGDASLQDLLDMRVSLDFEEAYLDPESAFARYRRAMLWNPARPHDQPESLREVLLSLKKGAEPHGGPFRYRSPNSDLLGLVLERLSGRRLPDLFRDRLWLPARCRGRANVTVDREGTSRTAGGMSLTAEDLARFGEVLCNDGMAGSTAVVESGWVRDTLTGGDAAAWKQGDFHFLTADGRYRNQWYQTGFGDGSFFAVGIHGQWLYAAPERQVVIVRFSSQAEPVDDRLDQQSLALFRLIAASV